LAVTKFVIRKKKKTGLISGLSKAEPWRKELKDLADIYTGLEIEAQTLRQKNDPLFTSLESLETQKEEVKIRIQTIARERAEQGRTLHLVNLPWVSVQVCGNQESLTFDTEKAVKLWPEDLLSEVLVVDSKRVHELLAEGREGFSERLAMKAANERKPKTPAVTLKVKLDKYLKTVVKND
jgi:hypothetical protein